MDEGEGVGHAVLVYRDAFKAFVRPHIKDIREEWDNLAGDTKIVAPVGRQKQIKDEEEKSKQKAAEDAGDDSHDHRGAQKPALKPESSPFADQPASRRALWPKDDKEELDWDKIAETIKDAADSPTKCQHACQAIDDCLQWRYKAVGDGECQLGKVMRLGRKAEPGKDDPWTSGWIVEKVEAKAKEWECKEVNWKFYQ
jgi:hypothetical protein